MAAYRQRTANTKQQSRKIGAKHERRACRYLQRQGLKLLYKNYSCRYGEIDLIMLQPHSLASHKSQLAVDTLIFVEVRFRDYSPTLPVTDSYSSGLHNVAPALSSVAVSKQRKIITAAQHFLTKHLQYADCCCRFDICALNTSQIVWIKQAFELEA